VGAALDIRIITAPSEVLKDKYLVTKLAKCWSEDGHRVTIGPAREVAGDVALLHVNLTRVPASAVPVNPSGVPLLNGAALDISKRVVSRHLVQPGDGWTGPVIIKTDANSFGAPEHKRSSRARFTRWRRHAPWRVARTLPHREYPVLDAAEAVPDWVWRRDDLVVERFLPELSDGCYVLRSWLFFGRDEYAVKLYCDHPVVKNGRALRFDYLSEVPASLRAERERLGFDFGKFDYVERDGEAVLLDANKTPTVSGDRTPNLYRLAGGLLGFLG
jgi:hypothetical protein